jgi:hypothetical protein
VVPVVGVHAEVVLGIQRDDDQVGLQAEPDLLEHQRVLDDVVSAHREVHHAHLGEALAQRVLDQARIDALERHAGRHGEGVAQHDDAELVLALGGERRRMGAKAELVGP